MIIHSPWCRDDHDPGTQCTLVVPEDVCTCGHTMEPRPGLWCISDTDRWRWAHMFGLFDRRFEAFVPYQR